jgi:hypothetical protein
MIAIVCGEDEEEDAEPEVIELDVDSPPILAIVVAIEVVVYKHKFQ